MEKATTTFNLVYCLRKMGKRVLAVDFDSQANLTTCFGVDDTGVLDDTIGHLMMAQIEDMKLPPRRSTYGQRTRWTSSHRLFICRWRMPLSHRI